jgi:predicted lipoprotein with Yx(FWY)xxD motif
MRGAGFVLAAFAVVLLAACGSSSSTASPAASSSTTGSKTKTSSPPVVMAATNATLGTVLVDVAGKTLYTLTNASGAPVACTGQCLTFWPPLLLPTGATTASGATGVTGLGTVSAGGGTQVTENGAPLFHFSGDGAPGSANGEGISSFGGTWHVVKSSAKPVATTAPKSSPTPAPTPTTSSGGYGYP